MVQKKKISKALMIFISFIIFFPINLFVPSSLIVMGNEIVSEEGGNGPKLTGSVEKLQKSEDTSEYQISILTPDNGLSFNELIKVSGEVTEQVGTNETVSLVIYENDKLHSKINNVEIKADRSWSYDINVQEPIGGKYLDNKTYSLLATIGEEDEEVSNTVLFNVQLETPSIEISSHIQDKVTNKKILQGKLLEQTGITTLEVFLVVDNALQKQGDINSDANGNFSYQLRNLVNGENTVMVRMKNNVEVTSNHIKFIYDQNRPFVSTEYLSPKPNMSKVPLENLKVIAKIIDENINLSSLQNPIAVTELRTGKNVIGTTSIVDDKIVFTPNTGQIKANTKYLVNINPAIIDEAGNLIHSRNWTFTTASGTKVGDPHGGYKNNTNTCKVCHSAHNSSGAKLQQGDLSAADDPNGELQDKPMPDTVNGYCMSCHDGTVASNAKVHMNQKSDHNKKHINRDGKAISQSCGNCHNVHLDYSEHNPNLLKDHFVYDHVGVQGVGKEDSSKRLCETCHLEDLGEVIEQANYEIFTFRNWNTNLEELNGKTHFGQAEDYSLCIRCHNTENASPTLVNIEKYYTKNGTIVRPNGSIYKSGHFISKDKVKDGSLLDGNMPCADCHDTHSSSNIGLIKSKLGHNNQRQFEQPNSWTGIGVRNFCVSCHNGETELYGITLEDMSDHMTFEADCSSCHGGTIIDAAHAPDNKK